MQQIAHWLQRLDLGQCAERFSENDINFAILPDPTDLDLKELGVASLGHRRQLLRAITELKGGETGTPKPSTEDIAPVTPHDTAERRQVTVMFSDLVLHSYRPISAAIRLIFSPGRTRLFATSATRFSKIRQTD
jgi:hypothetical protein